MPYVKSMLDVYELVLQRLPNYKSAAADKVKQEILHGLGKAPDVLAFIYVVNIREQQLSN